MTGDHPREPHPLTAGRALDLAILAAFPVVIAAAMLWAADLPPPAALASAPLGLALAAPYARPATPRCPPWVTGVAARGYLAALVLTGLYGLATN